MYDESVRRLLRLQRAYLYSGLGGVLAAFVLVPLAATFDAGLAAAAFLTVWLVTLVAIIWLGTRVGLAKCPRCRRRFFALFTGLIQRSCAHCGLGVEPT